MKRFVLISALLGSVLSFSGVSLADSHGRQLPPAMAGAKSTVVTATVTAIDLDTRQVTLKGPKGNTVALTVGEEVRNLPQVKVGDRVDVELFEALVLELRPAASGVRMRIDTMAAERAPEGAKPGMAVVHTVDFVATVQALDKKDRLVTLRGARHTVELKVSKDVNLKKVKVGDNVEGTYMQAFAVAVSSEGVPQEEPDGAVDMKKWSVGFILGGSGGSGELYYQGKVYPLEVSGVSVGATVGITRASLHGGAYNLSKPEDIEGAYGQSGASIAVVGGGQVWRLRNGKTGVILRLRGKQAGLELALNVGGMNIAIKK